MSAPRLINPPPTSGGVPVGGSGTVGTLPIWVGASTLGDSAVTQVSGSIFSLTGLVGGTGYTNTSSVALGGGTGTGATASITATSGAVTWVGLLDPGSGYTAGDVLTIPGGGNNATITVLAVVPRNTASGHLTAQRIGAGTTNPNAGLDSRFGAFLTGYNRYVTEFISAGFASGWNTLQIDQAVAPPQSASTYGITITQRSDRTGSASFAGCLNSWCSPQASTTAGPTYAGLLTQVWRSYAADAALNANLTGLSVTIGTRNAFTYTTANVYAADLSAQFSASGTVALSRNVNGNLTVNAATTITEAANYYGRLALSASGAVTTFYGLRLQAASITAPSVRPTNYWGVSQEDSFAKNQFSGNVGVGVDPGAGKAISALALTAGGTLYTTGTYSQVALTGGTGTGATADIVISGGAVTTVVLRSPGQGYVVGDVLSVAAASVGGTGSGFQATVATVASIARADGQVVAPRIGAGTTTPRAALDAVGGALISGFAEVVLTPGSSTSRYSTVLNVSGTFTGAGTSDGFGITSFPKLALGNSGSWGGGVFSRADVASSTTGGASWSIAVWGIAQRYAAADAATDLQKYGVVGAVNVLTGVGAATTANIACVTASMFNQPAGHTVTSAYWFDGQGTSNSAISTFYGLRLRALAGTGAVTNRYPISQEDTLGTNFVRAKTHFGAAVGTAAATTASIEVTAQGTLNGDVRINSASAVFDASASSTNGTKYFNRGGVGISTTTQSYYEEGSYTPTTVNYTLGSFTATWTRIGRKVFVTINSAAGTNNGSTIAGASSIGLPAGLAPVRSGLGLRGQPTGAASGNGMVAASAATGLIEISTTVTLDTNAKVIQVEYEV